MKKLMILLVVLLYATSVGATNITISDPVELVVRSVFLDGNYGQPDSVRITTWYNGSQVYDAWFNTGDGECYTADGWLAFTDAFSDIDGAGGDGSYTVIISAYDIDSTLYTDRAYSFTVGGLVDANIVAVAGNATSATNLDEAFDGDAGTAGNLASVASADVTAISGSTPAADELEEAFDGDTTPGGLIDSLRNNADKGDTNQVDGISTFDETSEFVMVDSIPDDFLTPVKFDSLAVIALYLGGIWIDENSGNTDSDVGVDGLTGSPVSTFAAAKILADSMNIQKYYMINKSTLTLAATHESWEFIGIGAGNEINFGGQDIDASYFENVMIAGIQGGTEKILLHRCYLDAADSLECVATNSWFSDTISVRVSDNIIFDQCYSAVPGNDTPGLNFNSAGDTICVNMRHYSGGLALFNMTTDHTISYETDGQLVIDASNTSANITARGNMTITDNGTTTALTDDAVFNKTELIDDNWDEILTGATHNIATSAGRRLRQLETGQVLLTGTINTANDSTATLGLSGAYPDGFFEHTWLVVIVGADSVQIRQINNWTGATDSMDMAPGESWTITPANGDAWEIVAATGVHVVDMHSPVLDQITANNAAYPPYLWKMVVNGSPTAIAFTVGYIADPEGNSPGTAANDFCLGQLIRGIDDDGTYGNSNSKVVSIADFAIADSTFTIRPALASAFLVGDTVFILPYRGAVEPSDWTQFEVFLSAQGRVTAETLETSTTVGSMETGVVTANAVTAGAWLEMKNYVWANMDTSLFPTDSSDFMQYLIDRFSGSVSLPDSLLEMIAVTDSILISTGYSGGISILARLGGFGVLERVSTDSTAHVALLQLLERLGPFGDSSVSSTPFTVYYWMDQLIKSKVDSILASLGFDTTDLHTKVDNLSLTGGGTEPETLIVLDTADTTQVSGARITVRTIDQSTVKVDGLITDVNGKLILDLDSDSFFVATVSNNYQQALDTIVVAVGGQTDTIWVVPIDPAAASGPNMVSVYIDTWDIVGDTVVNAKLEITVNGIPPYRDSDSSVVMIPRKITVYTDTLGRAQTSIWKSSAVTDLRGNEITYNFKLTKSNYFSALFEDRTAPDSGPWKIR